MAYPVARMGWLVEMCVGVLGGALGMAWPPVLTKQPDSTAEVNEIRQKKRMGCGKNRPEGKEVLAQTTIQAMECRPMVLPSVSCTMAM